MGRSFWRGRLSWRELLKEIYREYKDDNVANTAAILGYYFVYSLFPFLFFLATLAVYIPHVQVSMETLLSRAHALLPPQVMRVIDKNLRSLVEHPRPHLLTVGLAGTIYSASRGVNAVRKALNLAYDVKESRRFWKTQLLAFAMTIAGAALVLFGIAALVAGGDLGLWAAGKLHIAPEYVFVWRWLRWPVTATLIMASASVAYYLLPNVEQSFRLITPGSLLGTLVWLLATWGFSQYAGHFGKYNVTFGSIGGVVLLMTWFYISGFIFLIGGEINAILESADDEAKRSGARPSGPMPPSAAERPSALPLPPAAPYPPAENHPR